MQNVVQSHRRYRLCRFQRTGGERLDEIILGGPCFSGPRQTIEVGAAYPPDAGLPIIKVFFQ